MSVSSLRIIKSVDLYFFALVAICSVIYWPGLSGSFFFDDGPSILAAPGVKLDYFSWENVRQAWYSGSAGPSGRPLAQISFAINYFLNGFSPFAFKLTNLAIHYLCGALVYGLSSRILHVSIKETKSESIQGIALGITAVWLLHPIQLLPVLHVVQRMTSLSALFLLAAMYAHIDGREHMNGNAWLRILIAWAVLWPMSVLSKETGLLFPLFALAWELIIRKNSVGRLDRYANLLSGATVLTFAFALVYMLSDGGQWLWAGYEVRPFTMLQRMMTEARVLWFYLGQIFLPRLGGFGLYHDDFVLSTSWSTPWTTLPSILGISALLIFSWFMRIRAPLVTFGLLWFFVGHLMESTVLPLELVHEHRNYLPMLGILFVVLGAWNAIFVNYTKPPRIVMGLVTVFICSTSLVTALRAHQFGDEIRRTQMAVHQHSLSARTQYEAGSTLVGIVGANDADPLLVASATQHLRASMDLNPDFKMGGLSLIYLACKIGQPPKSEDLAELTRRLQSTFFAPGDRNVLYMAKEMANNGTLCLSREQVDGLFNAALTNPTASTFVRAILFSWYADYLWLTAKDMVAARNALSQAMAISPANPSNRLKWAQLLYISGDRKGVGRVLLELKASSLTSEERRTRDELLRSLNIEHQ